MEQWKDIEGYEKLYQVSDYGRVRSSHYKYYKVLKTNLSNTHCYCRVKLLCNKHTKDYYVHDLVVKAFPEICGEWFEGAQVNHKNEIKTDNRACNLEVCDSKYNINYGAHGYFAKNRRARENLALYRTQCIAK